MKICKYCGNKLEDESKFCNSCGKDTKDKEINNKKNNSRNIQKVIVPIVVVFIIGVIGIVLAKDNILYSYYKSKGDKTTSISESINYYSDALEIKYTKDLVNKISDKVREDENFEDILINLKGIVNEEDLNNIYIKTYVKKAKENFNNKNYETSLAYLNKAQTHNYNIETFEYYNDLVKITEKDNKKEETEVVKQDIRIYRNDVPVYIGESCGYYIIEDSSTRYLSKQELYGYDKGTLALIRNEIFARHGYIFKKQEYKNYFANMPWYSPNPNFKGRINELNSIEKYNVELIKSLE